MQETIEKIYDFIKKLVFLLEYELDDINNNKKKSAIQSQKSITDILNKLVNLLVQLNKINQDYLEVDHNIIAEEDEEIIKRFLQRKNK